MKQKLKNGLVFVFELLAGILLLMHPIGVAKGVVIVLGVVLYIVGIVQIIHYFQTEPVAASFDRLFTRGLIFLAGGSFCLLQSYWLAATLQSITVLCGIIAMLKSFIKVQKTVDSLRLKDGNWVMPLVEAVIGLACATVLLCNPFDTTKALWMFVGIFLIVDAILAMIAFAARKGA